MNKNEVTISGAIKNIVFSHEIRGNRFYSFQIDSTRLSGKQDTLQCMIHETLLNEIKEGEPNTLFGELRTRDAFSNGKNRLFVYIFVKSVGGYYSQDANAVELSGFMSRPPVIRRTPLGKVIADTFLAYNRVNGRSDYIPLIVWGSNAKQLNNMQLGIKLCVNGRLQSREYVKKYDDGSEEVKIAYELSINRMEVEE